MSGSSQRIRGLTHGADQRAAGAAPGVQVGAVERMRAGENVSAPASELPVRRKLLFEWKQLLEQGRPLRTMGRPARTPADPKAAGPRGAHSRVGSLDRTAHPGEPSFLWCLAEHRGTTPAQEREFERGVLAQIEALMRMQGELRASEMCTLVALNRANYRCWLKRSTPNDNAVELRAEMQRICIEHRRYGYRRVTAALRYAGFAAKYKRVRRLMKRGNLLALRTRNFVVTTEPEDRCLRFTKCRSFGQGAELTERHPHSLPFPGSLA
jgi:hypothetical protein